MEQLTLGSALGAALTPGQIARVSFLRLARLAADGVEIAHHAGGWAEAKFSMQSIRDDLA